MKNVNIRFSLFHNTKNDMKSGIEVIIHDVAFSAARGVIVIIMIILLGLLPITFCFNHGIFCLQFADYDKNVQR